MSETTVPAFEVLLIDEFAKRLKVGRSTIFDWKKKGILKAGQHYIKQGRVLRFFWAKDALLNLCEPSEKSSRHDNKEESNHTPKSHRRVGINLDY
nr:hypothetical protein [uncultured Desulfobacter sp.]